MARKITSDSRVRMEIKMDGFTAEGITMTAGAWNTVAVTMFEASERMNALGCPALAKNYKAIADSITAILTVKGYFR